MKKGQALLVGLLVIFAASIALAVAGAVIASTSVSLSQNQKLTSTAYNLAQSCLEDTLMQMDRGNFSAPADLLVPGGQCTIEITPGVGSYQILSTAELTTAFNQKVTKKVQAGVSVENNIISLVSQKEIY